MRSYREPPAMPEPTWLLVPWCVFAVAAANKFWQLNRGIRRQLGSPRSSTAAFRQRLERIWQLDPAPSDDSTSRP